MFAKYLFFEEESAPYKYFDYSEQDSLFYNSGLSTANSADTAKLVEKRVDSNQELLDFSDNDIKYEKNPGDISLNKADINLLSTLPGIGLKTAQKIVDFRNEKGGFKKLEELMEVKGIGIKKFNAIKKYLFIE